MEPLFVVDLMQETCLLTLKVSAPVLAVAFVTGLVISLIQALTQIQEATISFVPKLVVILCATFWSFDFMLLQLIQFSHFLFDQMASS